MPSKYQRKSKERFPYKKIIIAMEGNHTEPKYFREVKSRFRTATLNIELLEREKSDTRSAPNHVIRQLNEYKKKNKIQKTDELWLIMDKDRWPVRLLSEITTECSQRGFCTGISTPCFEVWLILHYEDLSYLGAKEKDDLCSSGNIKKKWEIFRKKINFPIEKFIENIQIAVENSKKTDLNKESPWPETVGTRVYLLAESIINNSRMEKN